MWSLCCLGLCLSGLVFGGLRIVILCLNFFFLLAFLFDWFVFFLVQWVYYCKFIVLLLLIKFVITYKKKKVLWTLILLRLLYAKDSNFSIGSHICKTHLFTYKIIPHFTRSIIHPILPFKVTFNTSSKGLYIEKPWSD